VSHVGAGSRFRCVACLAVPRLCLLPQGDGGYSQDDS
jgi:hypothetical protein